jgi:two-component system sensor histidine kinase KdpD
MGFGARKRGPVQPAKGNAPVNDRFGGTSAEALLKELGLAPRLTVYLGVAPGAGKTRRLLEEAIALQREGTRVVLGWIETKGRPDLERLAAQLPRVPPRRVKIESSVFEEFDYDATLAMRPQFVVLDELAHENLAGSKHAKRWEDALALRDAGIGVAGALNIQHVEAVASAAQKLIGYRVREIVPMSFLRAADQVVAIDLAPEQFESRLASGAIVAPADVAAARGGIFRPQTLSFLREMMLRTIDDLTEPAVMPRKASTLIALATGNGDLDTFLRKSAAYADALDLALDIALVGERDVDALATLARDVDAHVVPIASFDPNRPRFGELRASLVSIPFGPLAQRVATSAAERDVFIVDPTPSAQAPDRSMSFSRYAQTAADRMRIGYGKLSIYLGAAAGSGKTYAMLERAHQLREAGVDVVGGFIETHGRAETEAKIGDIEVLPRRTIASDGVRAGELDLDEVLRRHPKVVLIDELAHTNAIGDEHTKRFDDVLQVLRAGISVITTLNVQHLEGLGDAVYRLTGQRVRETIPDDILAIADEVILIDTTPETLRDRLRAGKIYRKDKIDSALANFFKSENLSALRELALREVVHARGDRKRWPFARLALGVKAREREIDLIERCARLTQRLEIDFTVVHVAPSSGAANSRVVAALEDATRRVRGRWRTVSGKDPAAALVASAHEEGATTIAVEGARHKPLWPRGVPFGRRLLDAGAKQILILAASD